MKYYLLTYYVQSNDFKTSGYCNVAIDIDPIDWWIKFKNNILLTNPVKYYFINSIEISIDQYDKLIAECNDRTW